VLEPPSPEQSVLSTRSAVEHASPVHQPPPGAPPCPDDTVSV